MSQKSRLIQLNEWAVIEYVYSTDNLRTFDLGGIILHNTHTQQNQFLNDDYSLDETGNVLDRSASRISLNQFVLTDIDVPTQYIDIDSKFYKENITLQLDSLHHFYDTVKIHILSGYNFEGIEGFLNEISVNDNRGKKVILSSQAFLKTNTHLKWNSHPLFLGDRMYDRWLEFKIPSLREINRDFNAQPNNDSTLGYILSTDHIGFNSDSLIDFTFYEIQKREVIKTFTYLNVGQKFNISFPQEDTYYLFSCVIQESLDGDFFEYFPTYDGEFIDNYVGELNSIGGDWVVIHALRVYEQLGADEIISASFSSLQENQFDRPNLYRPIIMNSDCFSFSIEYTCSLMNRRDGSQIIRFASMTHRQPVKYGRVLQVIRLQSPSEPHKIYNRVINSTPIKLNPVKEIFRQTAVYYPSFIESFKIAVSNSSIFIDKEGNLADETTLNSDIIWGQGECMIFLNPFDNYIKFKIYEKLSENEIKPLDLNYNSKLSLTFVNDSENENFENVVNSKLVNFTQGEIVFKIPSDKSSKLLKMENKNFYLTIQNPNGDNVVLYQGKFENFINIDKYQSRIEAKKLSSIQSKINELEAMKTVVKVDTAATRSADAKSQSSSSSFLDILPLS